MQCDVSVAVASLIESGETRAERQLAEAQKTLAEKPEDLEALYKKASALLSLGRNEEALEPFNVVAEKAPPRLRAHFNRERLVWDVLENMLRRNKT